MQTRSYTVRIKSNAEKTSNYSLYIYTKTNVYMCVGVCKRIESYERSTIDNDNV